MCLGVKLFNWSIPHQVDMGVHHIERGNLLKVGDPVFMLDHNEPGIVIGFDKGPNGANKVQVNRLNGQGDIFCFADRLVKNDNNDFG